MKYIKILIMFFSVIACSSAVEEKDVPDAKIDFFKDTETKDSVQDLEKPDINEKDNGTDHGGKDLNIQYPVKLKNKCEFNSDCKNACASSSECKESHCEWLPEPSLCIIKNDEETSVCLKEGMSNDIFPCLLCNPAFHSSKWTPFILKEGFEAGADYITVSDETGSGINWNITDRKSHSGKFSLYCGDPVKGSYSNGKHVKSNAITKTIKLPSDVLSILRFSLWMETEKSLGYDVLKVFALKGTDEIELFNSDSIYGWTNGAYIPVEINLSELSGKEIKIEFLFDTIDAGINAFEGIYIDDLIVRTDCCSDDFDCDDFNACTNDSCTEFGKACINEKKENCCVSDSDCSDNNPCTEDRCKGEGLSCAFLAIKDCCVSLSDCDDNDECTEDSCSKEGVCKHKKLCCKINEDCVSNDKCLKGKCENDKCLYDDICCKNDLDCNDMNKCTLDICVEGDCIYKPSNLPGCCYPEITSFNFDDGSDNGFTFDPPVNGVGWQVVNSGQSNSIPYALYFGNPSTKKYDTGWSYVSKGSARSQPIFIPQEIEVSLSFQLYMDTESGYYSDILYVRINTKDLVNTAWQKSYNVSMKSWQKITIDVTAFGSEDITIEFYFDSVYGGYKYGEGVYIDDIRLDTTCENKKCSGNAECPSAHYCKSGNCSIGICNYVNSCCESNEGCDDSDVCTTDSCNNKKCSFIEIPKCCETEFDCDDKNACTLDICSAYGGSCTNEWISGCCLKNLECDDKDICTKDLCLNNLCEHLYICCKTDEECDDNDDKCTIDKCVSGFCKYELTGAEGCCKELIWDATFDYGEDGKFSLSSPMGNNVGWHYVTDGMSTSPSGSLYYGNPSAKNFDSGAANSGNATTDEIVLPKGMEIELSFMLYQDTEQGGYYDELMVNIEDVSSSVSYQNLWSSTQLLYNQYKIFTEIKLNLSAFAGKTIKITLFFDTKDSIANQYEGIYIDDFMVKTTCLPKKCVTITDCDDGNWDTYDYCLDGVCYYTLWYEDF